MKTYLFLGDTHADLAFAASAAELAAEHNAEIIQVGDWGYIWPTREWGGKNILRYDGNRLNELSKILADAGVTMRFIDGNHDWHEKIWEMTKYARSATEIAPNVIYQPRGSIYIDADLTSFCFMGGAPSIDKDFRTDGVSWWATEEISYEDMTLGLSHGKVDVLVTHDAPDLPPGFLPKGSPEFRPKALQSNQYIQELIDTLKPSMHIHGHWHHAYVLGKTRGLDCNTNPGAAVYLWSRSA